MFPLHWASSKMAELGQVDLHNSLVVRPKMKGKLTHLTPYKRLQSIWTQVIPQNTGIVFPHQPSSLHVWMEISMNFHGLETILWPLRVYGHDTPP